MFATCAYLTLSPSSLQRAGRLRSTSLANNRCSRGQRTVTALRDKLGMAGRYTDSYLDRSNGWRAVATLADIGRASLVGRIPLSPTTSRAR